MTSKVIREGFHTVTPYLIVRDASQLLDFIKHTFGAVETFRSTGSAGGLHIEVMIGDSMVMIGGGRGTEPTTLYLYIEDVDAVYQRALQAGATSISVPTDQEYGERVAGVKDQFGNTWYLGAPLSN